MKINYFHHTGKQFEATDFKESEIIDLMEMRETGKIEHFKDRLQDAVSDQQDDAFQRSGIGFTAPLKTAPAGFAGFVDTDKRSGKPDTTVSTSNLPGHTYREELRTGSSDYRDMPLDATTQSKHQAGGSGEVLEQTPRKPQAGGSDGHTGSLYPVWIAAVKCGECRPSVDETWKWIQKRIAPKETGSKTNDRTRIGKMQKAFFVRAIREGLMQVNPVYRNGGKKYIWIG